jgi:hypothetical protein
MRPVTAAPVVVPPVRNVGAPVDVRPLDPQLAGRLALAAPDADGRRHVSAASGLAEAGGAAWVVSDEYGELARFDSLTSPGRLLPGLVKQKGGKPDLEALLRVPTADGASLLVAFGSGSKDNGSRARALAQGVDAAGAAIGAPREVSIAPLLAELDRQLPLTPNLEGLALREGAAGQELLVFHRGKIAGDVNVVFRLDAARAIDALRAGRPLDGSLVTGRHEVDLGSLGGERLGFADARALADGRIAFIASAEGGDSSGDGEIKGSVVGILDAAFGVQALRPLTGPARKVEGIELTTLLDPKASATSFTLVTDPDDPTQAAEVLTVDLG